MKVLLLSDVRLLMAWGGEVYVGMPLSYRGIFKRCWEYCCRGQLKVVGTCGHTPGDWGRKQICLTHGFSWLESTWLSQVECYLDKLAAQRCYQLKAISPLRWDSIRQDIQVFESDPMWTQGCPWIRLNHYSTPLSQTQHGLWGGKTA